MKTMSRLMSHGLRGVLVAAVALAVSWAPARAQNAEATPGQSAPSTLAPVALGIPSVLSGNLAADPAQGAAPVNRKDPVLAGFLSWMVPGVGSFYAGNSGHGVMHLVIEGGAIAVTLIGIGQAAEEYTCDYYDCWYEDGSYTLLGVGFGALMVNGVWSIFTAVSDAKAYNRASAPGGGRQPGRVVGSLYLDPQVRVLSSRTADPRTRTSLGFQVGRVAF